MRPIASGIHPFPCGFDARKLHIVMTKYCHLTLFTFIAIGDTISDHAIGYMVIVI